MNSDDTVEIECPACGFGESAAFTPTIRIGFDAEVTIQKVYCSECDYTGPPECSS